MSLNQFIKFQKSFKQAFTLVAFISNIYKVLPFFFLLFFVFTLFWNGLASFLSMFDRLLSNTRATSTNFISLDTLKRDYVKNFPQVVIRDMRGLMTSYML